MIIDIHTHAFPDHIAERGMNALEGECKIKGFHNGTIKGLLDSMDKAGIDKAVLLNLATKPKQFEPILEWSKNLNTDRIIPFLSVHPHDNNFKEKIQITYKEGFKGIKIHPYYQNFIFNENRMLKFYEEIIKHNLILISHTGFDIAFPKDRICDPVKIIDVINRFPELKLVTTHFGAWKDWEEVEKHLIGKNIYIEISFSLELLEHNTAKKLIESHPADHLLFGTDSPWTDQKKNLEILYSLNIDKDKEEKMLYKNAVKLLDI